MSLAHIQALPVLGRGRPFANPMFSACCLRYPVGTTPAYLCKRCGKWKPHWNVRVKTMLRAEIQNSENGLVIRLEGRFSGEDAEHVRTLVTRHNIEKRLVVDLKEVTFIDTVGEATLSFLSRLGAKFIAQDVYLLDVCKRLNLTLSRNRKRERAALPPDNACTANDD